MKTLLTLALILAVMFAMFASGMALSAWGVYRLSPAPDRELSLPRDAAAAAAIGLGLLLVLAIPSVANLIGGGTLRVGLRQVLAALPELAWSLAYLYALTWGLAGTRLADHHRRSNARRRVNSTRQALLTSPPPRRAHSASR